MKYLCLMKMFFNKLHYAGNSALSLLLLPFSFFYGLITCFRNYLYDKNFLKSVKLPAFVVSIGNLTTGGTGKTPITREIANYFNEQGKKTAVISRGYGGKLDIKNTNVISNGEKIFYDADLAGDEPYWIAKNSPNTIVITGKDRVKSGRLAVEKFKAEVILLDDGFQHRRLHRDVDIVLIDSAMAFGNGFLLPVGPLREHISALRRADRIIMTDRVSKAFVCRLTGEKISGISRAMAFSGIARPEPFFKSLEEQNIELVLKISFPDHYLYTEEDVNSLSDRAKAAGAEALITTEKDMVKIEPFIRGLKGKIPIYALKLKVNIEAEELFKNENPRNQV